MTPRILPVAGLLWVVTAIGCGRDRQPMARQQGSATAVSIPLPADVRPTPELPDHFSGVGRVASNAEVQAWNIDANSAGAGLPAGSGTYARGAAIFAAQCAMCHGPKGEGLGPYPRLIGREPRGFPFGIDPKYPKTIGNYWPYATTVFDYVHRAMPFTAPGTLKPDDIYSVVAFLLAENEIISKSTVIDARSLPNIRMPGRDRFVVDDRRGGREFR
ncbi:MAG TPA: cytochrome c [Gemmatimonadaceae bacterium]